MSIKSALSTDQEKVVETGRFSGTAEIRAISGKIIHQINHGIQPVDACIFLSYNNSSADEHPANGTE